MIVNDEFVLNEAEGLNEFFDHDPEVFAVVNAAQRDRVLTIEAALSIDWGYKAGRRSVDTNFHFDEGFGHGLAVGSRMNHD